MWPGPRAKPDGSRRRSSCHRAQCPLQLAVRPDLPSSQVGTWRLHITRSKKGGGPGSLVWATQGDPEPPGVWVLMGEGGMVEHLCPSSPGLGHWPVSLLSVSEGGTERAPHTKAFTGWSCLPLETSPAPGALTPCPTFATLGTASCPGLSPSSAPETSRWEVRTQSSNPALLPACWVTSSKPPPPGSSSRGRGGCQL